ncbi:MAG TPA: double zinc ribbon domain-containing protein [Pyrinomonadaceae bacterium]|nr:double zinc ribbon domain-containing protein [Pyrinomonadaceae bacterium]
MFQLLPDPILSIIYPQACDVCEREVEKYRDGVACRDCWNATRIFNGNETLCTKCGAFLFAVASSRDLYCQTCAEHFYVRAISVGIYEKALAASVLRLKRSPFIARHLEGLILQRARSENIKGSSIVLPVPLSPRRYRERGFNQAAVIAKLVSRNLGLSVNERILIRETHTPTHRAGMDKKARAATVKNAFAVERSGLIDGQHVLLVDDVMTSGETVSMCAKALKKSGAATVSVLTVARAA